MKKYRPLFLCLLYYLGLTLVQFQHPEVGDIGEPMAESNAQESGIFFEPESNYKLENLSSLHPSFQTLPRLREIYADRVDPWIKILHLPNFWAVLTEGLRHPYDMPKSVEAAIFAFYLATVSALSESCSRDNLSQSATCTSPTHVGLLSAKLYILIVW